MKTIVQNWLEARLGIVFDLSPEHFGRHTKDGRILAKLLYSYGIIPQQIYNSIKSSKYVNECFKNLKVLKPWLEYLSIPIKDDVLYEIASSQGTASMRLFYTLYLSLESKDKLYYISSQKERRYSEDCNKRNIKVEFVPERVLHGTNSGFESELALPIIQKNYMIEWHRKKCNSLLEKIKNIKTNYSKIVESENAPLGPVISRHPTSKKLLQHSEIENVTHDLNTFDEKHAICLPDLNYEELISLQKEMNSQPAKPIPNFKDATDYVTSIQQKFKKRNDIRNYQESMHFFAIHELKDAVQKKQDDEFEDIVVKHLLKQSQLEKQFCTKLALAKEHKNVLVKNRMMIEELKLQSLHKDSDDCLNYNFELAAEESRLEELYHKKMAELHKRLYLKKVKLKFEERLKEAKSILDKIIDITIRVCEFRELYACEIPRHMMKDMKELFFRDMPIFDIVENLENLYQVKICRRGSKEEVEEEEEEEEEIGEDYDGEGDDLADSAGGDELRIMHSEECGEAEDYDPLQVAERIRQEVLNECDFNDYLFLLGPWAIDQLLPDEEEAEVQQFILGYIVHKILECKYPLASVPRPALIKPMYPRAVVQGWSDETEFTMFNELMKLRKIMVVRVDDAVNFVLKAYKEESSAVEDIDMAFQQATKSALKAKRGMEKARESSKKEQLLKKEVSQVKCENPNVEEFIEVATQTPRNIPEDDPLLSHNAEIGKLAFEALGIGDPVPDGTAISAVIAYVIDQQENYDGWVLWNYPVLYSQASKLECALTGFQLINIEDEMDTVEGIEGFNCRIDCLDYNTKDKFADQRLSRLVPKPEGNKAETNEKSYFSSFIRLKRKGSGETIKNEGDLFQTQVSDDYIEKFYKEQEIFEIFEYSLMSFQTVKDVGKLILGGRNDNDGNSEFNLTSKASAEIFGKGLLELNSKFSPQKKKSGRDLKKPLVSPKHTVRELSGSIQTERDGEDNKETAPDKNLKGKKSGENSSADDIGVVDAAWEWATGQQPEEVQLALASFWESMEAVYIEDFKSLFLCLRIHRSNTVKYKSALKKSLQKFMLSEEKKQALLSEFQHKFNDIYDDLRPDADVKCELHVRVSELEEALCQLADDRKEKSEQYRIKFISDNWVANEVSTLVNLYLKAIQLESDRCMDTCQFINDYYLSLQQKVFSDDVFQKIKVPRCTVVGRNNSILSSQSRYTEKVYRQPLVSASRTFSRRGSRMSSRSKNRNDFEKPPGAADQSEREVVEGVEAIMEILVNMSFPEDGATPFHRFYLNVIEEVERSITVVVGNCIADAKKSTVGGGRAATEKDKKKAAEGKSESNSHLISEWSAALECELKRFLFRLRIIKIRGILDLNEFLLSIMQTFIFMYDEIGELYDREIASIFECCKVFRCAIEEETGVQPRLELYVDEFFINQACLLFRNPSVESLPESTAHGSKFQFTIEQLTFIFKKLQYINPDGFIVRRAFLYILEDLRVIKSEDGVPRLLPDLWDNLNPNDLPKIFDQIYKRLEIVNWKDFLIYALELPMPSDLEILNMRSTFRSYDQVNSELISFKDFMKVDLWFENYRNRFDSYEVKEFLFKLYQVDEEFTNYTALLLSFCKDDDPSLGFTKALCLSLGKRVIVDDYHYYGSEEGEREELMDEEDIVTQRSDSSATCGYRIKAQTCQPKYGCPCKDPSMSSSMSQPGYDAGEAYSFFLGSKNSSGSLSISNIPCEIVAKVLLSSYPSMGQLCSLLSQLPLFHENVRLLIENLSEDGMTVRASQLLKHKFIHRLLTTTNKFKAVDLRAIVLSISDENLKNMRSNCSDTWT